MHRMWMPTHTAACVCVSACGLTAWVVLRRRVDAFGYFTGFQVIRLQRTGRMPGGARRPTSGAPAGPRGPGPGPRSRSSSPVPASRSLGGKVFLPEKRYRLVVFSCCTGDFGDVLAGDVDRSFTLWSLLLLFLVLVFVSCCYPSINLEKEESR